MGIDKATMEKFGLRWNDFQTTVSNSFKLFRQEKNFFDVTLVSDDQKQFLSHKVILSACSSFFQNLLKNNDNNSPIFIYLSGVNSTNLQMIMDYIYDGEVDVLYQELDSFLDAAQKLKIAGTTVNQTEEQMTKNFRIDDFQNQVEVGDLKNDDHEMKYIQNHHQESMNHHAVIDKSDFNGSNAAQNQNSNTFLTEKSETLKEEVGKENFQIATRNSKKEIRIRNSTSIAVDGHDQGDVNKMLNNMRTKEGDYHKCTVCGKMSKDSTNIKRHVEIHLEGRVYGCKICNQTFKNRWHLKTHTSSVHRP